MNGKQLACVVLLMIIGAFTYAAQMVHKNTAATLSAAAAAEDEANQAANAKEVANINLMQAKDSARELQRFLAAWKPQVDQVATRQEVEETIQSSTRRHNVFVESQKFEDKANRADRMMPRSVMASMVLEDEYAKVMNWLGDLEKSLPLARVTNCRISAAGSGRQIHLEIAVVVPLVDLSVDPTGLLAKKS